MSTKYKTVITSAGAEKLAAAAVPGGKKVNITTMAVGDGGGTLPEPNSEQTKLIQEVWRHSLNKISQDNNKKNYIVAELVVPPEVGGFWMRELGLYDDTGTLIAIANMAESYKPELAEGSGRAQTCRMVIIVSSIEAVELYIDSTTVMASQGYIDEKIAEHEQSRNHPDASTTEKGFVQLSSSTDSNSEKLAVTPKALKVVNENANSRVPSIRKINNMALTEDITITAISGNAGSATKLAAARKIGGVAFDGSTDINLPGVNTAGNQNTTGNAGSATKLAAARKIGGVAFDGSKDINLPGVNTAGNQNTTGNAGSATKLATARKIGGVAFDGSKDINLPGVNTAGNQNTTGNAGSATKLQTGRTINGVLFDGTKNITITAGAVGSYTKTESDARYVQSVRLGAMAHNNNGNNGNTPVGGANGTVITKLWQRGDWISADYRPLQYQINGVWYNVGVA